MANPHEQTVGTPLFPQVHVRLVGEDGNAFAIMGRVQHAMQRAGIEKAAIDEYLRDSMSGDYNHLLRVAMATVTCDDEEYDEDDEYDD